MSSLFLSKLQPEDRLNLLRKLWESQKGKCFICGEDVDLELHKNSLDVDHITPTKLGGKDDPVNFALTHASCNRSKQASDLNVAKILAKFQKINNNCLEEGRSANLSDILKEYDGAKENLSYKINEQSQEIEFTLSCIGDNRIIKHPIYEDRLSGFKYFFSLLPIEYLFHDDKINPRAIGQNISKFINEFFLKRPQLHISLGYIFTNDKNLSPIKIFDGQHKAAAQMLLGTRRLPVRVFIDPDPDLLLKTNTNAGTTLVQVAFDKSVQRHLGNELYIDRVKRYQEEKGLEEGNYTFSEDDLVRYFKGESREMKRYILDSVRDSITHSADNKLKDYIDFGGRGKEKPLSYSTIEKTFYSFFIYQNVLESSLNYLLEEGNSPRELEKEQILKLINIVAEEIYIGKFDPDIGTSQIENKVQKGEDMSLDHLRAFRLSKEEIIYNWLKYIGQIIKNSFIMQGKPIDEEKLFQYRFPEPLWDRIRTFIINLAGIKIWIDKNLSTTTFGGKQNYKFWQTIFETGRSPQGFQVLSEPLDLMKMIKD